MLAAPVDHLDGSHSTRSRLSTVSLLPRDPAFLQELEHDVHMGPWRRELLHEITQDHLHQLIPPCGHGVYHDVTPVDGVGAHSQIVLNFAQDELLCRPAVVDDAVEPGMLLHGHFMSVAPQFLYELIGGLQLRHALHLLSYVPFCQRGRRACSWAWLGSTGASRSVRPRADGRWAGVVRRGWAWSPWSHAPVRCATRSQAGASRTPPCPAWWNNLGGPRTARAAVGLGHVSSGRGRAR